MKQLTNAVSFKSVPSMWGLEKNGQKANTLRWITREELEWFEEERPAEIYIVNTETKRVFIREISHFLEVSEMLGKNLILISWRHP